MTHHVALQQELINYRGQNVEADVYGILLPGFWLRKSEPALGQDTGELVAPTDLPHFALLARLYRGVEATSCQAERNFSSLSVLIGTSRASLRVHLKGGADDVREVEPGRCLPEVQKYNAVIAAQKEIRSQCVQDVQLAQEAAAAGETVDVEI